MSDTFGVGSIIGATAQAIDNGIGRSFTSRQANDATGNNARFMVSEQAFNMAEAAKARDFNSREAQAARWFNAEQANENRWFNSEEALKGRFFAAAQQANAQNFTEGMSNTAYQRAMRDMRAAGLNPMLAYSQGGATTPGASGATSGIASGSAASGPSASGGAASSGGSSSPGMSGGHTGSVAGAATAMGAAAAQSQLTAEQIGLTRANTAVAHQNVIESAARTGEISGRILSNGEYPELVRAQTRQALGAAASSTAQALLSNETTGQIGAYGLPGNLFSQGGTTLGTAARAGGRLGAALRGPDAPTTARQAETYGPRYTPHREYTPSTLPGFLGRWMNRRNTN